MTDHRSNDGDVPAPPLPDIEGYERLEMIGRGGFSRVYSATQQGIDRRVAIKVLDVGVTDDRRFLRECRTLGTLSDIDGTVGVIQATFAAAGNPCIVMPLMSGGSMGSMIRRGGPLTDEATVAAGLRLSAALERAHRHQIFHRDIKPENVLYNQHGEASIADFGIAMVDGVEARSQTIESISPPHAPPERFSDSAADPALGDIYSLASTLWTALAGSPPFGTVAEGGMAGLISRVLTSPLALPDGAAVDPALLAVLERAMSKDPDGRQRSMAELHADLLAAGSPDVEDTVSRSVTMLRDPMTVLPVTAVNPVMTDPPTSAVPTAHIGQPTSGYDHQSWGTSHYTTGPYETGQLALRQMAADQQAQQKKRTVNRVALAIALIAVLIGLLAGVAVITGVRLSDEATPVDEPTTTVEPTAATTSTPPETTAETTAAPAAPDPPPTTQPTPATGVAPTQSRPTAAPVPLPISEATTAVDIYLAAGSSFDTDQFAAQWQYPVDFYYGEKDRNVGEAHIRERSETYWADKSWIRFSRTGPTTVAAADDGWATTTPYRAELQKHDGTTICKTQRIHLEYSSRWKVRRVTEDGYGDC